MEVARRDEISLGEASIYCNLDIVNNKSSNAKAEELSAGTAKEYKIEIERIFINNDTDNKSMLIKVKDEELLAKTGGIIQGMSGSPVVQNGNLYGAITNVLVNDPTQGYAVFGDIMLKEMRED